MPWSRQLNFRSFLYVLREPTNAIENGFALGIFIFYIFSWGSRIAFLDAIFQRELKF